MVATGFDQRDGTEIPRSAARAAPVAANAKGPIRQSIRQGIGASRLAAAAAAAAVAPPSAAPAAPAAPAGSGVDDETFGFLSRLKRKKSR